MLLTIVCSLWNSNNNAFAVKRPCIIETQAVVDIQQGDTRIGVVLSEKEMILIRGYCTDQFCDFDRRCGGDPPLGLPGFLNFCEGPSSVGQPCNFCTGTAEIRACRPSDFLKDCTTSSQVQCGDCKIGTCTEGSFAGNPFVFCKKTGGNCPNNDPCKVTSCTGDTNCP